MYMPLSLCVEAAAVIVDLIEVMFAVFGNWFEKFFQIRLALNDTHSIYPKVIDAQFLGNTHGILESLRHVLQLDTFLAFFVIAIDAIERTPILRFVQIPAIAKGCVTIELPNRSLPQLNWTIFSDINNSVRQIRTCGVMFAFL